MKKKTFDGRQKLGEAPAVPDGEEILRKLQGFELNIQMQMKKLFGRRKVFSSTCPIGKTIYCRITLM
jgi:hypothetical protein